MRKDDHQAPIGVRMEWAKIPPRFETATLSNYDPDRGDRRAYDSVRGWSTHLKANMELGEGLLLQGEPGTGKTHLAVGALKSAIEQGCTGYFCSLHDFVRLHMTQVQTERGDERRRVAVAH